MWPPQRPFAYLQPTMLPSPLPSSSAIPSRAAAAKLGAEGLSLATGTRGSARASPGAVGFCASLLRVSSAYGNTSRAPTHSTNESSDRLIQIRIDGDGRPSGLASLIDSY